MKKKNFEKTTEGRLMRFATENKVYCDHCNSGYGAVFRCKDTERKLCKVCGYWIYRDPKTKLKYEMIERGVKIDS